MKKIKVGIIGASGYVGVELVNMLLTHPHIENIRISSRHHLNQQLSDLYPALYQLGDLILEEEETVIAGSDLIFLSMPHGLSQAKARLILNQGKKCIDMGADFRLHDENDYEKWYHHPFAEHDLHEQAVYGLSEINRSALKKADLIGNPGCYPTACALALYPLFNAGYYQQQSIVIDAKSGVTGAGKGLSETTHFAHLNEGFAPYNAAQHRHGPEIEQTLSELAHEPVAVTFVPHLLPLNRGILATIYVSPFNASLEAIYQTYVKAYHHEPFVRVLPLGKTANLKHVQHSNYCDISLHLDSHTSCLIVVSAIDNMIKGAAGQALQNMNIMYDFAEDAGLHHIPYSF